MASTAARAALSRAVDRLNANDRNILTMHGRYGISAVMDWLKVEKPEAEAALERIKQKLAPMVQQELRKPPELPSSSSLAPPERVTMGVDRPLLRSRGEISESTPAKRRPGNFKPKPCKDCGETFKPTAPRQVKCDECRGVAPVTVTQDPTIKRAPPPAVAEATPAPASSNGNGNGHGTGAQYLRLRDELRELTERINSFAADFERLVEDPTTTTRAGGSDDP